MNDTDALKIAMFYFADRVLHGRKDHCQINFNLLNEVDDINHFRSIPWGRLSWETIYKSIDNVLNDKAKKFKKASAENPLHRIEKYNFYGFTSAVHAWIFEAIEGLPLEWVEKIKRKGARIVRWKPVASLNINFGEVYSYLNERLDDTIFQTLKPDAKERATNYWKSVEDYVPYLPSWVRNVGIIYSIIENRITSLQSMRHPVQRPNEVDPDPTSPIGLEQSLVEDAGAADDHYESAHDSDDRNEPEARTKFRNDYFVGRLDKIESSIHELRSELQTGHSSINELRSELMAERREAQQYRAAVMGFMASFGAGASKGAYGDSPFGPAPSVSKFRMFSLCYYDFKPELMLICSSPRNNRPQIAMVRTLMLAIVRILMLVMTTSTPLCPCTVYMGTYVMTVYRYSRRHLPALVSLGVRTDHRIYLAVLTSFLISRELGMSGLYPHSTLRTMKLMKDRVWI
ncbi:uncharacterized protein LOC127900842 [Citrus sinensis]|uniref:uncharacterized protein LOC127900842 n=1 Tax=Citrus sinensis TaxID=2711 RepID=UPI0022782D37|nr:uncharacterized protein LOC127900842 [Citrus sinensis]